MCLKSTLIYDSDLKVKSLSTWMILEHQQKYFFLGNLMNVPVEKWI